MENVVIENKKDVIPAAQKAGKAPSSIVTIRVVKAHDGLAKGAEYKKPRNIAEKMEQLGYWEII